jgi:hypothetical protein
VEIDEALLLSARNHFYIENFLSEAFVMLWVEEKEPHEKQEEWKFMFDTFSLMSLRDGTTQKPAVDNIAAIIFGSTPRRGEKKALQVSSGIRRRAGSL